MGIFRFVVPLLLGAVLAQPRAPDPRPQAIEPAAEIDEGNDQFVYDVVARFNEAVVQNIDALDNAFLALVAGATAIAVFTADKIYELAPTEEHWALVALGCSALLCFLGYASSYWKTANGSPDPRRFVEEFGTSPTDATLRAISETMQVSSRNLAVRSVKRALAFAAMALLFASTVVVLLARAHGSMVQWP